VNYIKKETDQVIHEHKHWLCFPVKQKIKKSSVPWDNVVTTYKL